MNIIFLLTFFLVISRTIMKIEIIISELDFYIIEKVRELRIKSVPYVDQMKLAHQIGVSEGYIGNIENPKVRAKYNIRMLARVAKALNLDSYEELLPKKILKNDLVRIQLKLLPSKTRKPEIDEKGNIQKRFELISKKPLNDQEIYLWKKNELKYLKEV